MTPGPAQILSCPYCGAHKEVLSLLSGNTFGQEVWSDNKTIAPMLPRVSFVQKCSSCGGYFLMSRQIPRQGSNYSFEQGELSYLELKEAWESLKSSSDRPKLHGWRKIKNVCGLHTRPLTDEEKLNMLIMQVWAFNDEYTRKAVKPVPHEEKQYISGIIDMLLDLDSVNDLLKAEFLREMGRFEESMSLINSYSLDEDVDEKVFEKLIEKFKEEILASNTRPFLISDLF